MVLTFHVNGFIGLGKSYVCELLKTRRDIVCVDLDDVDKEIKTNMLSDPVTRDVAFRDAALNTAAKMKWFWGLYHAQVSQWFRDLRSRNAGKSLVIVGMSINLRKTDVTVDLTMHIGMDPAETNLVTIYHRFMLREVAKLRQSIGRYEEILKNLPPSEYDRSWYYAFTEIGTVRQFPVIWDVYEQEYNSAIKDLTKSRRFVMTQRECATVIAAILDQQMTVDEFKKTYWSNNGGMYLGNRLRSNLKQQKKPKARKRARSVRRRRKSRVKRK